MRSNASVSRKSLSYEARNGARGSREQCKQASNYIMWTVGAAPRVHEGCFALLDAHRLRPVPHVRRACAKLIAAYTDESKVSDLPIPRTGAEWHKMSWRFMYEYQCVG